MGSAYSEASVCTCRSVPSLTLLREVGVQLACQGFGEQQHGAVPLQALAVAQNHAPDRRLGDPHAAVFSVRERQDFVGEALSLPGRSVRHEHREAAEHGGHAAQRLLADVYRDCFRHWSSLLPVERIMPGENVTLAGLGRSGSTR